MKIDDLNLAGRTAATLDFLDIFTVEELLGRSPKELIMSPNFGRKSWADLLEALRKAGVPENQIADWVTGIKEN